MRGIGLVQGVQRGPDPGGGDAGERPDHLGHLDAEEHPVVDRHPGVQVRLSWARVMRSCSGLVPVPTTRPVTIASTQYGRSTGQSGAAVMWRRENPLPPAAAVATPVAGAPHTEGPVVFG